MAASLSQLVAESRPRFRTATEYVESVLRDGILSGRLAGGMPLRQEELAAAFGTSRMPVREALRQLEAKALVDFHPHRGAVVAEFSAADAADVHAIRRALEMEALRLSIPSLTAADLELARELVAEMDQEGDPERTGALNQRFHRTLSARAGRPRLLALLDQQLAASDRYLRFHLEALGRHHLSQEEHRAMIAACAAHDADSACQIVARHVTTAERNLLRYLSDRETS